VKLQAEMSHGTRALGIPVVLFFAQAAEMRPNYSDVLRWEEDKSPRCGHISNRQLPLELEIASLDWVSGLPSITIRHFLLTLLYSTLTIHFLEKRSLTCSIPQ
jgi:hypothetical protein